MKQARKYDDSGFWTLFFQSSYFKKDVNNENGLPIFGEGNKKLSAAAQNAELEWLTTSKLVNNTQSNNLDQIIEPRDFITSLSSSAVMAGGKDRSNPARTLLKNINKHSVSVLASQYKNRVKLDELDEDHLD